MAAARKGEAGIRVHLIEGFNPDALARKLIDLKDGASRDRRCGARPSGGPRGDPRRGGGGIPC